MDAKINAEQSGSSTVTGNSVFRCRDNKSYLRMLLDVEGLQSYLTYAFGHFSGTLESPFDFVQASFINSPIPANFGGNILKLAISVKDVWQRKLDQAVY